MPLRRSLWFSFALVVCFSVASSGQEVHRGRKYKAPPLSAHIEVQVLKKENGKPIMNAAVVFNPSMNGKDLGNLEVKTDPDGKAIIDVIPVGSKIEVQVIATGFATFAQNYDIDKPSNDISISMVRPRAQISAYQDNDGKASSRKPGVQEPIRPKPATTPASATPPPPGSAPAQNSTTSSSTPKQ